MKRIPIVILLFSAPVIGLAGCGETPEDKAESTVRDFAAAFNDRSPKLCKDIYSDEFIKVATGKTGSAGLAACQRELKKFGGRDALTITVRSVSAGEAKDGKILVSTTIDVDGQLRNATFRVDADTGKIEAIG